jgi:hypothetical protein
MAKLIERFRKTDTRSTFEQWIEAMSFGQLGYNATTYTYPTTTYGKLEVEAPDGTFGSYVNSAYKANGVVFACITARLLVFSEARFQFQHRGTCAA